MAAGGNALTFTSGGRTIAVERFDAAGGGRRPAVILLHGADGMSNADRYSLGAQVVAAAGYHVFLVHYLERTGERRAYFSTIGRGFPLWTEAVRDAVGFVERQAGVDAKRLGMLGTSLGGALAVTVAAEDSRVKAVVNYFGFLPGPRARDAAAADARPAWREGRDRAGGECPCP
jgi:carboxymethylenebutenolidase